MYLHVLIVHASLFTSLCNVNLRVSSQGFEGSILLFQVPRRRVRPLHGCLNQASLFLQIAAGAARDLKLVGAIVVVLSGVRVVDTEVLADQAGRNGMGFVHGASAEMLC